jgi:hypothetical protein
MPPPGGPEEVYRRFEEDNHLSHRPEGILCASFGRSGAGLGYRGGLGKLVAVAWLTV